MSVAERLRQEGMEEGAKREKIRTVKSLISMGLTIDQIIKATGLTRKEIEIIKLQMDN